jgi:protoporphyrinogen oxidase
MPLVPGLIPNLPDTLKSRYAAIRNIGVVCVVHKLRRSVTDNFWLNINDDRIDIPGIVQFSRLRDVGPDHVVYVPYYMPTSHAKFGRPDAAFIAESFAHLKLINPALTDADLVASHVGRLRYAQPVCGPRFLETLPPVETGLRGLQIADTCSYYPEDRGIAESVRFGRIMAENLEKAA